MKTTLTTTQWLIFLITNAIMAPLSIGHAFGLPPDEIAGLIQRTLFTAGISSVLQVSFGHKLPIAEGPASVWWGVFLIYGNVIYSVQDAYDVMQTLSFGLLLSGLIFILLGVFRLTHYLGKLFTPLVTATYLILLAGQLSGPFLQGMLGIGYYDEYVNIKIASASLSILLLSYILTKSSVSWLSRYSVLISLTSGWILFKLFNLTKKIELTTDNVNVFPEFFPYGVPKFDFGVLLTVIITTLLILTNLLATVKTVGGIVSPKKKMRYDAANIVTGINQSLTSMFTTVGNIPFSATAGFIITTKAKEKRPFIYGSMLLILLSLIPALMLFFSSIPAPVGYATIFLPIANLAAVGVTYLINEKPTMDRLVIFGLSLMFGFGAILLPAEALLNIPVSLRSVMNNGLILGVLVCIILENLMKKKSI